MATLTSLRFISGRVGDAALKGVMSMPSSFERLLLVGENPFLWDEGQIGVINRIRVCVCVCVWSHLFHSYRQAFFQATFSTIFACLGI